MKNRSILAAPAIGLLLLACAWPAHAGTQDGGGNQRATSAHGDRGASARQSRPAAKSSGTQANADSSANATSSSEGGVGVGSQGQSLNMDNHARASASSALAPALTGSNDTCMGSTSVGAAGLAFGVSFGSTYTDDNCMMLKNARELWNMGFRGAAIARMCMDERNRQALEATGVACPAVPSDKDKRNASARPQRQDAMTDPIPEQPVRRDTTSAAPRSEQVARSEQAAHSEQAARRESPLRNAVSSSAQAERFVR